MKGCEGAQVEGEMRSRLEIINKLNLVHFSWNSTERFSLCSVFRPDPHKNKYT